MNFVYLDNAAAMPADELALDDFRRFAMEFPGNQEAGHGAGYAVRKRLELAERELAGALCPDSPGTAHVIWSHTGTDAIGGTIAAMNISGGNIVTSKLEHPAMLAALRRTKAEIRYVEITRDGQVNFDSLRKLVDAETGLVVLFHVQSETGAWHDLQALLEIRNIINAKAPKAEFMLDTIQSAGKMPIPWQAVKLDYIFVSGHKIGAPGGAAVITRSKAVKENYTKLRHRDYLTGRVEPATILAMVEAVKRRHVNGYYYEHVEGLNRYLRELLADMPGKVTPVMTAEPEKASSYIVHCTLPGFQSAIIVRMLSEAGFIVAAGSACAAEAGGPSAALKAMGFSDNDAFSGLRISFSEKNTRDELATFVQVLQKSLLDY